MLWNGNNEPFSGHLGIEKTYDRIFYWPVIYRDVRIYVSHCKECQRYKSVQTGPQGLMTGRMLEKRWMMVSADLMHFPRSSTQNKYLLIFQDLKIFYKLTSNLQSLNQSQGKKPFFKIFTLGFG